jgi:hypothetical protein
MNGLLSFTLKRVKQQAVIEFLTHKNQTAIEIHRQLLAFCGEDAVDISTVCHWVRKLRDSGRNLDLNDQPWSVTATHCVNRQKVNELITKIKELLREP